MFEVPGVQLNSTVSLQLVSVFLVFWDLTFPELPCMELLLVAPGGVTHFPESCPKSVLDVLLDSSKATGGPVAHQTVLLPFISV